MLHHIARAALLSAAVTTLLGAGVAQAAPPPITVTLTPIQGLKSTIQRVAAQRPGEAPTWNFMPFVEVRNLSSATVTIDQLDLTVGSQTWQRTSNFTVGPGATQRAQVVRTFAGGFPHPLAASLTTRTIGFDAKTTSHPLAVHRNETPTGAYKFPYKSSDFPAGTYPGVREQQDTTSHHFGNPAQIYAHDVRGMRWTGSGWSELLSGMTDPKVNANYIIFDRPLYAVDEGTIIACRRSMADQVPGVDDTTGRGGGNFVFLRTGGGETVFYAHMKQWSLPASLCPVESRGPGEPGGLRHATPVQVKAGQLLGRTGNTGSTSHPHLHIEVFRGIATDINNEGATTIGLPMHFDRLDFWRHSEGTPGSSIPWVRTPERQGAAMGGFAIARAHHPCGWDTAPRGGAEWVIARSPSCFQEGFDDTVNYGYQPMELEGASDGTQWLGEFRPVTHGWVARTNLTSAQYQSAFDQYGQAGYSLRDVDSYVTGGAIRYHATWTKQPLGATLAYHEATAAVHQERFNQHTAQGYRPILITVARLGTSSARFTAVYRKVGDGAFLAELVREADFQSRFNTRTSQGYRPVFVDGFNDNGTPTFSVIWTKGASPAYVMRHAMSLAQFTAEVATQVNAGRRIQSMTAYRSGTAMRYAAIWR